jgi:hypothetical protein
MYTFERTVISIPLSVQKPAPEISGAGFVVIEEVSRAISTEEEFRATKEEWALYFPSELD